jgi:hypothetical protein
MSTETKCLEYARECAAAKGMEFLGVPHAQRDGEPPNRAHRHRQEPIEILGGAGSQAGRSVPVESREHRGTELA